MPRISKMSAKSAVKCSPSDVSTGCESVIADFELLITDAIPKEPRQRDFERAQRKPHEALVEKVGVGQRDAELIVFVADRRTQKEGAPPSRSRSRPDKNRVPS